MVFGRQIGLELFEIQVDPSRRNSTPTWCAIFQFATLSTNRLRTDTTTAENIMIRPVSEHQLQRAQKIPARSPGKPMNNMLLSPSSPLKNPSSTSPKSPLKKAFISGTVSTIASSVPEDEPVPLSPRHGPLKAKLRASVLQAVLRLLDQNANSLAGAHEVLQAAAALPLAEPGVQRACLQALRELGSPIVQGSNTSSMPPSFVCDSGSTSNSKWNAADTTFPTSRPRKQMAMTAQKEKSSGRAKGLAVGSLHHCKEFLLACANEIHDLEDEHSARFDYAEDTASSSKSIYEPTKPEIRSNWNRCGTNFDYASTVPDSFAFSVESDYCDDEGDDDTRADQGSQLSEVLHSAEYLGDDEVENSSHRIRDRAICRQVLHSLHTYVQSRRQSRPGRLSAPNLAVKFRIFEALKFQASFNRKRLAFQRLKTGVRSRHQQRSDTAKSATFAESQRPIRLYDVVLQTFVFRHADVLVLLLALAFLANLPAKYIM